MYLSDWSDLQADISWLVGKDDVVEVSPTRMAYDGFFQPTTEFIELFPTLSKLLNAGRVTDVKINGCRYLIYGWTNTSNLSFGWQCLPGTSEPKNINLHPHHALLLSSFGGIKERWNEPDTWLLNLNSALCPSEVAVGFDGWADYYFDICREMKVQPKANPADYRVFAKEANGDCTIYHHETGEVLMFAHDHCFDHIKIFANSPEYTLYTINNCPDFCSWVENVAEQWLQFVQVNT